MGGLLRLPFLQVNREGFTPQKRTMRKEGVFFKIISEKRIPSAASGKHECPQSEVNFVYWRNSKEAM